MLVGQIVENPLQAVGDMLNSLNPLNLSKSVNLMVEDFKQNMAKKDLSYAIMKGVTKSGVYIFGTKAVGSGIKSLTSGTKLKVVNSAIKTTITSGKAGVLIDDMAVVASKALKSISSNMKLTGASVKNFIKKIQKGANKVIETSFKSIRNSKCYKLATATKDKMGYYRVVLIVY